MPCLMSYGSMRPNKSGQYINYRGAIFIRFFAKSFQRIDSTNAHIHLFVAKLIYSLRKTVGKLGLPSVYHRTLCHLKIPLRYPNCVPRCKDTQKNEDSTDDLSQSCSSGIF